MGIIARFTDIMQANINALLDRCEDPAKMIDQYLRDMTEQLAEVKKETAGVMAEETRAARLVEENTQEIARYQGLAEKAVLAGSDADAKVFLAKAQSLQANGADLRETYDAAHQNAEKMRQMHDKLTGDIAQLEARRQNVRAKVAVAKTQEKLNKVAGTMQSTSDMMGSFERMEAKADRMLDQANAMAQLNEKPVDEAAELEKKYQGAASTEVDDALAALKAKLGK